jgi:hypothetical protein
MAALAGVLVACWASPTFAGEGSSKSLDDLLIEKGVISKDEAASVQGRKLAAWVDRMTFSGDLRVRHESLWKDPNSDRHRERFRLRLGSELKMQDLTVGIRLASGTGEQTSTNQSEDNLFSEKQVWIDRAYLRWQGSGSKWLTLTGGKMPNPFFTVYSTDAMWDEDVTPEGFAENLSFTVGGGTALFANLGQFVLDEDASGSLSTDQWLFAQEIGVAVEPAKDIKTTLAAAYYNFVNTQNGGFGQAVCLPGNTRVPVLITPTNPAGPCADSTKTNNLDRLLNDYNVLDVTVVVALKLGSLPLSVMGDYILNPADPKDAAGNETKDSGYQAGLILGKASDPSTWEAAYFCKLMGTDATVADVADADFGDGGTDRKGHIVWVAYNPTKALTAKVKFFRTERLDKTATKDDIDRLQADLVVKF